MTQKLEIAYRIITGVNDTITVNYNSIGAQVCTISPGLYMNAGDLAGAVQSAIDGVWSSHASFEVAQLATSSVFHIDSTDANFTLTWGSDSLRDWMGYSGDLSGSSSYTGALPPGVLVENLPWVNDTHGWLWSTKGIQHIHSGQAVKVNRRDLWTVQIFERYENLQQLRSVVSKLMQGTPATWFRSSTPNSWDYSNWQGRLKVCVNPKNVSYSETFENPGNLQDVLTVKLELVAFT